MHRLALSVLASSLALTSFAAAHAAAAPPVGTLSCTGGNAQTPISANLSYFAIGAADAACTTSPCTNSKVTKTVVVHAALSQFTSFYEAVAVGDSYTSCVLTSSVSGATLTVKMAPAAITSVNGMASEGNSTATGGTGHANGEAYLEANIGFANIQVESDGANDGGVTVTRTAAPVQ